MGFTNSLIFELVKIPLSLTQTTFSIPQPFLTFSICPLKVAQSEVFPSNTSTAIGQPLAEQSRPKTI